MPSPEFVEPITIDKLKLGDVILVCKKGINPGSLAIKLANFFKNGYRERGWTHAAVYVGNGEIIEALQKEGVVKRKFKDVYLNGNFNLLALRHRNASDEKLQKAVKFYLEEKDEKYDFIGLGYFLLFNLTPPQLHFILNIGSLGDRLNQLDKYFCSELVSRGYQEAMVYCFEEASYKIMPSDFNNPYLFETIGRINITRKENKLIHAFKTCLFFSMYLFFAVLVSLLAIALELLVITAIIGTIMLAMAAIGAIKAKLAAKPEKQPEKR
jgi:hypothetical protein